jgi:hypothetical protein
LRLDGLHERLAHLDRTLAEVPDGLSENIQQHLARAALRDLIAAATAPKIHDD